MDVQSQVNAGSGNRDTGRLEAKYIELSTQLDREVREKDELARTVRKLERTVRELQFQLGEREKIKERADDDVGKLNDKLKKMKQHVEDLVRDTSARH